MRRRTDPSIRTGNQANLRRLQAKLTIGSVNDPLEQEADAAADRVMRMADPRITHNAPPTLSRKCAECEDGEKKDPLQRKAAGAGVGGEAAPPIVDSVLASPGHALDRATHDFMASRFGGDFSDVRIHTDAHAAQSATAIGARAYTVGRNVVFGAGQYDPASASGRHLLAHELAHTIQQGAGPTSGATKHHSGRLVQRACGEKQIGALEVDPTGLVKQLGDAGIKGAPIHFRVACDEFLTADEPKALEALVTRLGPRDRVIIHGFASEEGPPGFNEMLSVARAVKVRDIVSGLINPARIERTVWHGAVAGNRPDRRSVIIEVTGALPSQHRSLAIVSWINGADLPTFSRFAVAAAPHGYVEALGACMALKCTSNTPPPDTLPDSDWPAFIGSKQYRAFQTFKIEHYPASDVADTISTAQHVGYTAPSTCGPIPPDTFVQGEPSPLNHVDKSWSPKGATIDSLMKIRVSTAEETAAVDKATSFPNSLLVSRSRITHVPWVWSETKVGIDTSAGRSKASAHQSSRSVGVAPTRALSVRARTGNQTHLRRLQAKLTVGAVNDPLEQEADAAADRVMRMADPRIAHSAPPTLSRKCTECEDEEKKDPLQRKPTDGAVAGEAAPPIVDSVLASPGRALDPATHNFMASRFGADFSDVRIHTDAQAAQSATAIGARAYTVGPKVVFGAGQYDPASASGRHLLAHELAHVVQQRGCDAAGVRRFQDDVVRRDVPRQSKSRTVGKRLRESFPWIGRIRGTYSAALRLTPGKDPKNPHAGTVADLPEGKFVDVLGNEKGWLHVRATVGGKEVEGYVSQELVEFNRSDAPPIAPVPAGPIVKDIFRLDQTVPIKGLAKDQPNYIDHFQGTLYSAPIGPYYTFVPKSGPASQSGVSIPKDDFYIDADPLKGSSFGPEDAVYKSRTTAEAVVAALTQQTPNVPIYAYYLQDGIILPTTLSDTTVPNLMPHIRDKREADMEDIHASATLAQSVANAINPVPCTEVDADGSLKVNPTFLNCALPIILHAAPHVTGGKPGTSGGPGEAPSEPTSGDQAPGQGTGDKRSEIADAVAKNEVNAKQLAAEVAELRSDAGDPAKVHRPADPKSPYDAEMEASDGHEFHRDKKTQLWERCSDLPCKKGLKLDAETNKKVDAAVQTKDKPVPPDEKKAPPPAGQVKAPMKWEAGQIQGADQFRTGQTIAVAEIQHPDGTIEKVAACYEKSGWRPEQAERAAELGYKPLLPSKKGSGMHAEEEIAAYAQKVGGKVVHGHWAISRGRGGTSIVCDACENLTLGWGPPQGGKD